MVFVKTQWRRSSTMKETETDTGPFSLIAGTELPGDQRVGFSSLSRLTSSDPVNDRIPRNGSSSETLFPIIFSPNKIFPNYYILYFFMLYTMLFILSDRV